MTIDQMDIEKTMSQIVDQMSYLLMEMILVSLKKITVENHFLKELMEIEQEEQKENEF